MFDYLVGEIVELTPTYVVIDNHQIGYLIHVSVNTYAELNLHSSEKLFIHQVIREDAHLLFGFKNPTEREIFRMLISVSGIGANTARMILSSLKPVEIAAAISSENIRVLQNIKGIGTKTAQRLIIELKDKVVKFQGADQNNLHQNNTSLEEALSALIMLGFQKAPAEKALKNIDAEIKNLSVEELIKRALKVL